MLIPARLKEISAIFALKINSDKRCPISWKTIETKSGIAISLYIKSPATNGNIPVLKRRLLYLSSILDSIPD